MFKNRVLELRVKKDNQETPVVASPMPYQDPEQMNAIAKDFVLHVAKVTIGVLAVSFVLNAASQLIERALETND